MRHVFLQPGSLTENPVRITGPDFHHLARVLRVSPGERLVLLDGLGGAFEAEVLNVDRQEIAATLLGPAILPPEPAIHVTVAQAVGKGDRFEQVIQHGTEVGASTFLPLLTERTVVRLDSQDAVAKLERWRSVAKGAAEQCGRSRIPEILPPRSLRDALKEQSGSTVHILLDHDGDLLVTDSAAAIPIILFVGPEGGFTDDELSLARSASACIASLGPYTLRTETAAIVALSRILAACSLSEDSVIGF